MMDVANVIPSRLRNRPRDVRGLVIPFVQYVAADGTPNFAVLDDAKLARCLSARLCGLCGEPMGKHLHFVGGPACVVNRYFYDPAMHRECAVYALQTCPHLARSKGRYRAELPSIQDAKIIVGEMDISRKVERFALMHTDGYQVSHQASTAMVLIKANAWIDVEHWQDGRPVDS